MSGGRVKLAAVVVVFAAFASQGHHHHFSLPSLDSVGAVPAGATTASANEALGMQMAAAAGYDSTQRQCLNWLWTRESGWVIQWNHQGSGAYGIPQSLPASKMASAGADYMTNPATEIRWGLGYIGGTYGTACNAWAHEQSANWY